MPTLQNLTQYGIGNMSLNFGGNPPHIMASSGGGQNEMGFHIGSNSVGLSAEGVEQWRLQQVQQFPFLGSFEPPTGLYPFQNEDVKASSSVDRNGHLPHMVSGSGVAQLTAVKLLENQGLNLSRQFLDTSEIISIGLEMRGRISLVSTPPPLAIAYNLTFTTLKSNIIDTKLAVCSTESPQLVASSKSENVRSLAEEPISS
ncbi:hypothetical protein CK203_007360 [Vitis vinifera]|uniref:Uncharacterized protein n=1 Tax=Vitis vinifera TaxID=29760 RepID=A0A438G1J0_VITVI|nr:hypothetical protein CK203_007360 [Vitis vinifera]